MGDILGVKAWAAKQFKRVFTPLKLIAGGSISKSFLSNQKRLIMDMHHIKITQGNKGLVLYLKACAVCLQQSSSGYIVPDALLLGARISRSRGSRIPRIIPASHRLIIINKTVGYQVFIKYYLSVFYLYRVISFPGTLKLNTITDPGREFTMRKYTKYMNTFVSLTRKVEDPFG